jgi:hypothetical protein
MFKQMLENELWSVREDAYKEGVFRGIAQGFLFGLSCALPIIAFLFQPVTADAGQECVGLVKNLTYSVGTAHSQYFPQYSIFSR